MAVAERSPFVSLLELRVLFEEFPRPELVIAMCDQACAPGEPQKVTDDLIRAMYSLDVEFPADVTLTEWVQEEFTYTHRMWIEVSVRRWLNGHRAS